MKKLLLWAVITTALAFVSCEPSEINTPEEPLVGPTKEIFYTSSDGTVVTPGNPNAFGANIVSNTYENGEGVITFDDKVTKIDKDAFSTLDNLISITIPVSVTVIGGESFADCGLTAVTIPDGVTEILSYAFYHCQSLTSVTIGKRVTEVSQYAFGDCHSLAEVYCKPTTPPKGDNNMFTGNASGRKIYVPTASVSAYKEAEYWSDYAEDIVGYDF